MTRLLTILLALALLAAPASANVFNTFTISEDLSWQKKFTGAVKWSTLGIRADSGTTNNGPLLTANLPPNIPIEGDCPLGGYIGLSSSWFVQSGTTVNLDPGCQLESTNTTVGIFAIYLFPGLAQIINPNLITAPQLNIELDNFNFQYLTPTSTVRVLEGWCDHCFFHHTTFNNTGGGVFIRCGDCLIDYYNQTNTINNPGNPGIRSFGVDNVLLSPGMRASFWVRHANIQSGDSPFQTCQPVNTPANGTWNWNTSTLSAEYDDSFGITGSVLILVNLPQVTGQSGTCQHIRYNNVSGTGRWFCEVGNSPLVTNDVIISNATFVSDTSSSLPSCGIGAVPFGGAVAATTQCSNIQLNNITISLALQVDLEVVNCSAVSTDNSTYNLTAAGSASVLATVYTSGSSNFKMTNSSVNAGKNLYGFADGLTATSTNTILSSDTIYGVINGSFGLGFLNSLKPTFLNNTITLTNLNFTTAAGILLTAGPGGTFGATGTGNDVHTFPLGYRIFCTPSGQSNNVINNIGAPNCVP